MKNFYLHLSNHWKAFNLNDNRDGVEKKFKHCAAGSQKHMSMIDDTTDESVEMVHHVMSFHVNANNVRISTSRWRRMEKHMKKTVAQTTEAIRL